MYGKTIVSVFAACLVGCGSQPAQNNGSPQAPNPNLTIYSADSSGVVGSYEHNGETVNFETLRVELHEEEITEQTTKPYDTLVRVSDAQDRPILVLTEGHDAPEGWAELTDDTYVPSDAVFEAADAAAVALGQREFEAEVKGDVDLVVAQLQGLSNGMVLDPTDVANLKLDKQMAKMEKSKGRGLFTYSIQGIDSYWKPAFIQSANAHHTGTITYRYVYSYGSWRLQQTFVRCNHGTCPTDYSMNYYTTHWGPLSIYAPVTPQSCSGWYGVPHVCNNDTKLQQNNVEFNQTYNTYAGVCSTTMYYRPY